MTGRPGRRWLSAAGGVALHAARVGGGVAGCPSRRATALIRPSDHAGRTLTTWPRRAAPSITCSPTRDSTSSGPGCARAGRTRTACASEWNAGKSIACCRFIAEVHVVEEEPQRPLVLLVAAGRAERQVRLAVRAAPASALSVVRGRLPGASVAGSPGSSANICARVPRQKPSSGMTGEDCSQPPLGVADDHVAPAVGDVEVAGVAGAGCAGGRPAPGRRCASSAPPSPGPAPCRAAPRPGPATRCRRRRARNGPAAKPAAGASGRPGRRARSSADALSPTSWRRASVYAGGQQRRRPARRRSRGRRTRPPGRRRRAWRTRSRCGRSRRCPGPWPRGRSRRAAPVAAGRPAPGPRGRSCRRSGRGSRRSAASSTAGASPPGRRR